MVQKTKAKPDKGEELDVTLSVIEDMLFEMGSRSKLFAIVKKEMQRRDHWKAKPRGRMFDKGEDYRRNPAIKS